MQRQNLMFIGRQAVAGALRLAFRLLVPATTVLAPARVPGVRRQ